MRSGVTLHASNSWHYPILTHGAGTKFLHPWSGGPVIYTDTAQHLPLTQRAPLAGDAAWACITVLYANW